MNRDRTLIILSVLYFAILGCFLLGCSEGTDSSPVSALMGNIDNDITSSSTINGVVLNSSGNTAMPNIYVQLYNINNQFVKGELTDSDGKYTFTNIQNGTYTVRISADGYLLNTPTPSFVTANNGKTYPDNYVLFLTKGSSSSNTVYATVSGTVERSDKTFPANTSVTLCSDKDGMNIVNGFETSVLGDGTFVFFNVPGNTTYYIRVGENNSSDKTIYPINIDSKGVISPASITISINTGNSIKGCVLNYSTNSPLANLYIQLYDNNNQFVKGTLTDSEGNYIFTNIDNGVYTVRIEAEGYEFQTPTPTYVTVTNNSVRPDKYVLFMKSITGTTTSDEVFATIKGVVKRSDNSSAANTSITLCSDKDGNARVGNFETLVLGDGSFTLFNVPAGKNYFIRVGEPSSNEKTIYPIGIDGEGNVSPTDIIITVNVIEQATTINSLTFKVASAYTGASLELATIKINGENIGTTNMNGEIIINNLSTGLSTIEVSKEGFETLTSTRNFVLDDDGTTITITMIEDTKDGYGSITGRYVELDSSDGVGNLYVRLYRLVKRTQTDPDPLTNKKETWYDVDKDYILTTRTSTGNGSNGLAGSFKLTHIEPGYYQIYIGSTTDIPETELRPQIYPNFEWTQLKTNTNGHVIISQPFQVDENQTTYWTNYEQGNN